MNQSVASPGRFDALAERLSGRLIHALWLGVAGACAWAAPAQGGAGVLMVLAAVALPGILGLFLAGPHRLRSDSARLVLALSWTAPGFAVAALFASALSPAALVFLAGPAALAASGGRKDARLGALLAAAAFVLAAAASLAGPAGAAASGYGLAPAPWIALAAFFAAASVAARARVLIALDRAHERLKAEAPAAEGFVHAPAAILALTPEGRIAAASRALRRLVPGAPRRLEGLPADGLAFDEAQQAAVMAGLSSAREGGSADGGRFDFSVRAADGSAVPVEARAVATPAGFVVALEDRREAASRPGADIARLEAERDAAVAANRSKSEFLAAVSHELRTPLNAIIGFSDVMKQRLFGPLPARYAEYGDLIHESGTHLLELIGDVLDMSKIEADRYELSVERFDVRAVVEICVKMIRLRAEEQGVALHWDTGGAPVEVEADRKALRQILLNLLSNAVKFTPAGGAVVVMARAEGSDLVLAVGDSGVGIDADEIDALGQPYAQSRSARETAERGTGLGLSLVRSLADMHGGTMSMQSRSGEGTTVTVRLPVLCEPAGSVEDFPPLDVHRRIRAAQEAGAEIARVGEGAA